MSRGSRKIYPNGIKVLLIPNPGDGLGSRRSGQGRQKNGRS